MPSFSTDRFRAFLASCDRALTALEAALLSAAVLAMAVLNIANVVGRNLFDYSLTFGAELNRLLIVVITFAGIGYAARLHRHIRMTALSERVRGTAGAMLEAATLGGTGLLLLWLAWLSVQYVGRTAAVGSVTPSLRLPLYLIYVIVPLGLSVGGLQFLWQAVLRSGRRRP
jgi:C4-dicarboxylate transporter DctQ subunit